MASSRTVSIADLDRVVAWSREAGKGGGRDKGGAADAKEASAAISGRAAAAISGRAAAEKAKRPAGENGLTDAQQAILIAESIAVQEQFFNFHECQHIEGLIDELVWHAESGHFRGPHTVDATVNRTKYFFGYGYTYGYGKHGREELLPLGSVDVIPAWIRQFVIQSLVTRGIVQEGWINSVVLNDYRAGGSIVSHIDPPRLFARPIYVATFFSPANLVFGASFDPERSRPPLYTVPLSRGSLFKLDGYAADKVTHGMRPEDMYGTRRVSLVLRHIKQDAPWLGSTPALTQDTRSKIIREAQGYWHDEELKFYYVVQGLKVTVVSVIDPSDEKADEGSGFRDADRDAESVEVSSSGGGSTSENDWLQVTATWYLQAIDEGIQCSGGLLKSSGPTRNSLYFHSLMKRKSIEGFTWMRLES